MQTPKHPLARLASASFVATALGLFAMSLAAPGKASDPEKTQVQIKIVKSGNPADEAAMASDCEKKADKIDTEASSKNADGKTVKTRIVMCHMGKEDEASLLSRLQHARKTIADNASIPTEARDKALAAIDAEIAKLTNSSSGLSRQ